MKKLTIVFAFLMVAWFGVQQAQAAATATDFSIKCVPTYEKPCTNDPMNLDVDTLGKNASGGIINQNNKQNINLGIPTEGNTSTLLTPTILAKKPLKPGTTGTAVKALQQILHNKGYLKLKDPIDGKFGLNTKNAIIEIQKQTGVKKIDGIVGEETMKKIETIKDKEETITLVDKKNKNTLLKNYACKDTTASAKLGIWTGEFMDEAKSTLSSLSDVWTTVDGTTWKKEADTTKIGQGWERMAVTVKEGGKDMVYSFGAKYKAGSGENNNAIYKSPDFVNWTYVGELPDFSRFYDKSIVYYNGKFWAISSEKTATNGVMGIWNSTNGEKWTKVSDAPWDGDGRDQVFNSKGASYSSNSLGAFVYKNKMWYLVYDKGTMTIFSTTDGKKWTNEGALVDSQTKSNFQIGTNTNPAPVIYNGEVYIYSTVIGSMSPITIKTNDGKTWVRVTSTDNRSNYVNGLKDGDYAPGYYSSDVVFNGKLWKIGGLNNTNSNDNAIYSSKDGATWEKVEVKGVSELPGPADRELAGAAVITGSMKSKATNLQIARKYNSTGYFTGSDETGRTVGEWNLTANSEKNTKNTGPIYISELSFVGNNYTSSLGYNISTLEAFKNVTIYINDQKVGSVAKFDGPFFDKAGKIALMQTVKLDTPYILNHGDSVWVKVTADFAKPKFGNIEYRTFLNGIGFKDGYTTPCLVYNEEKTDGYSSVPGMNLYYQHGKLPN